MSAYNMLSVDYIEGIYSLLISEQSRTRLSM